MYRNFNHVLFIANADYYIQSFSEVHNMLNVRVMHIIQQRSNQGVNFFFVPVKTPVNPYAYNNLQNSVGPDKIFLNEFPVKNPIIFFFRIDDYVWFKSANINFFQTLKETYPDCKFVCSLNNPVSYYKENMGVFVNEQSIVEIQKTFDLIITYNKLDAANYGLTHYEGLYSFVPQKSEEIVSDIFYVGAAKDRLDKLHKIYEEFSNSGLKCDFWITGVPENFQKYPGEIHYNNYLNYEKVMQHVMQSRGILEIAQGGNYGLTMRFFEALIYDKNYITDNGYINQEKFRKYPKIFCVDNWRNFKIDKEKYLAASKLSNNYRGEYSPLHLLTFLEAYFNK